MDDVFEKPKEIKEDEDEFDEAIEDLELDP